MINPKTGVVSQFTLPGTYNNFYANGITTGRRRKYLVCRFHDQQWHDVRRHRDD